jgi:hypothetical protein
MQQNLLKLPKQAWGMEGRAGPKNWEEGVGIGATHEEN